MRHVKELAILALASTVFARALPQDDDVDGDDDVDTGDDDDTDYTAVKAPYTTPVKGWTSTGKPWTTAPPTCTPSYEAYVCDDGYGKGEYTTTFTVYPKGCPQYVSPTWVDWPATKTPDPWAPAPVKPTTKPYDPWAPVPVKPTTADPWAPLSTDPWVAWGISKDDYDWWVEDGKKGWPGKPGQPWVPGKDGKPGMGPKPAVPSGWGDWNSWVAPKPTDPAKWNSWDPYTKVDGKTVVIITKTETYYVPCSTGWATSSTVWYTEHCGCTATPVPVSPAYVTVTTVCPTTWGLGATVVYSTPVCSYTPAAATPVAVASTWVATPVAVVSTWYATPVAAASTWVATPVAAASTWVATPVSPAAATGTWSPVGVWKGAASSNSMSKLMVVGAGAVAGLAYLL